MACMIAHLDLVAKGAFPQLKRICGVDDEDLADMIRELRGYDPKPGLRFGGAAAQAVVRSEEHTSELQSLMRISFAVCCLKKKNHITKAASTPTINSPISPPS